VDLDVTYSSAPSRGSELDLVELRRALSVRTQADMAELLGVTPNTWARWERGELQLHPARRQQLQRLRHLVAPLRRTRHQRHPQCAQRTERRPRAARAARPRPGRPRRTRAALTRAGDPAERRTDCTFNPGRGHSLATAGDTPGHHWIHPRPPVGRPPWPLTPVAWNRCSAVFKTVARPASWSRVGSTPVHLRQRN